MKESKFYIKYHHIMFTKSKGSGILIRVTYWNKIDNKYVRYVDAVADMNYSFYECRLTNLWAVANFKKSVYVRK
jgi:hypothetical protein